LARRLATAGLQLEAVTRPENSALQPGKFILFRCTSADFFFSCCDSVAAPRQRPGTKNNYLRKTTSGAAGIGLGATD
jgi:hypothetical protein